MPVAVYLDDIERFELKTVPEGYVVIRRMNYGESLKRQNMTSKIYMEQATGTKDMRGEVDLQTERVALWEFANLIVEHNLTDKDERPLNFKSAVDVMRLAGPVGEEIGRYIDEWNGVHDGEEIKN